MYWLKFVWGGGFKLQGWIRDELLLIADNNHSIELFIMVKDHLLENLLITKIIAKTTPINP